LTVIHNSIVALIFLLVPAPVALGDGGAIQMRRDAPPFLITVFSSPNPPREGPTDISVLVQDRESLAPVLDAQVSLQLNSEAGGFRFDASANQGQASNKLLYAANVTLNTPGAWDCTVFVKRGDTRVRIAGTIVVAPAEAGPAAYWTFVAAVPVVIALFALHQVLLWRRRRPRYHPVVRAG
jgi:hypothetical protein